MKRKIFIMLPILLLLCACDINYDIKVNEDLTISETVYIKELVSAQFCEASGYENMDECFNYLYNRIKNETNEIGYEVSNNLVGNSRDVTITGKRNILALSNKNFEFIYRTFNASCSEKYCSINAKANIPEFDDGGFPSLKVTIQVPYKVLKHNADEFDLKNNTYIWYYIVGEKQSDIDLIFEKQGKNVIKINKSNSTIKTIAYISIGTIVLGIILYFVYKIIRNSKPY